MSRLTDAFDALVGRHPRSTKTPDAIFEAATAEVAAGRVRQRTLVRLASVAVLLVVVGVAAVALTPGDPEDDVRAGSSPTTSAWPTIQPGPRVQVYFSRASGNGCRLAAVDRTLAVTASQNSAVLLIETLDTMLEGPNLVERSSGLTSYIASARPQVRDVAIKTGGTTIDFDPQITRLTPDRSTTCGPDAFIDQLWATVQGLGHDPVTFRIDGDADAFDAWLGVEGGSTPTDVTRTGTSVHVLASDEGVELRSNDGDGDRGTIVVSTSAAGAAYAIGTDLVVFQGLDTAAASPGNRFRPLGGAIEVWERDAGDLRSLSIGDEGSRLSLLDAATLDDRPVALVAVRRGNTPEDTFESLTIVDLETGEEAVVVEQDAWESETVQARILPDGDVVAVGTASNTWSAARWSTRTDQPRWITPLTTDARQTLAVLGGEAAIVRWSWASGSHQLLVRSLDLDTGTLNAGQTIEVVAPTEPNSLWCGDWHAEHELSCADGSGTAIAVDRRGAVRDLATPPGAIVTTAR